MTGLSNSQRINGSSGFGVSPNREWLSYAEAMELVGLGRTTLWKLAGAGEIEVARVGRAVRMEPMGFEPTPSAVQRRQDTLLGLSGVCKIAANSCIPVLTHFPAFLEIYSGCYTVAAPMLWFASA